MESIVSSQLFVDVAQLPSRITEEDPARNAVVERAKIQEQQQNGADYRPAVSVEKDGLERRQECEFARDPGHDQKRRQRGSERSVRSHCFASSNAWSTRKYVI